MKVNKTISWVLLWTMFITITWVSAFENDDLKKHILNEIKMEKQLPEEDFKELSEWLDIINKQDFTEMLKSEIEILEDDNIKKEFENRLSNLEKEENMDLFLESIEKLKMELDDAMIKQMDANLEMPEDKISLEKEELKFDDIKEAHIAELEDMLKFVEKKEHKEQLKKSIDTLKKATSEEELMQIVDKEHEKINELYFLEYKEVPDKEMMRIEQEKFTQMKKDIVESLKVEIYSLKDEKVKKELLWKLKTLETIEKEGDFFPKLDEIYGNESLRKYYEYNKEDYVKPEEYISPDFNEEEMMKEMAAKLKEEINSIENRETRNKLLEELKDLESIENEGEFMVRLDEIQNSEALMNYYIQEEGILTPEEEMINALKDHVNTLEDEQVKNRLLEEINKIESAEDGKEMMIKIDKIYSDPALMGEYEEVEFVPGDFKTPIVEKLKSEINSLKDESIKKELLEQLKRIEAIKDEWKFMAEIDKLQTHEALMQNYQEDINLEMPEMFPEEKLKLEENSLENPSEIPWIMPEEERMKLEENWIEDQEILPEILPKEEEIKLEESSVENLEVR